MTRSSIGVPTEVTPWFNDDPVCAQALANFDPITASVAQLHYYGLPVRQKGEPLSHYKKILGYFKHRSCLTRIANVTGSPLWNEKDSHPLHALDVNTAQPEPNTKWAGNMADQPSAPGSQTDHTYHYSEIDSDWYIPWLSGSNTASTGGDAMWLGLGGYGNSNLVQAGSWSDVTFGSITYGLWYQNTAVDSFWHDVSGSFNNGNIYPGMHIFVRVDAGNCMEVGDIDSQQFHSWCEGPNASGQTAEAIMERAFGYPYDQTGNVLARYASAEFKGVGIEEDYTNWPVTAGYWGFPNLWHDYNVMYASNANNADKMASPAPLIIDNSENPTDDSPITWLNYN